MTEVNETLTHTVSFTRKKGLPGYSSVDAGLFVQFQTPADATLSEIVSRADAIQDVLAAVVFERLDLPYEVDPDTGRVTEGTKESIVEQIAAAFEEESAPPAPVSAPSGRGVGDWPPFDPETTDKNEKALNKKWGQARVLSHPDEFFDNRRNKLPVEEGGKGWAANAPDYKHKKSGCAVWL
jgi:hypothetical protein